MIAVVISIASLITAFSGGNSAGLGGERAGLQNFIDGIKAGSISIKWVSGKLAPGADDQVIYTNRTGRDVYADFGSVDVLTGETASTTFKVSIFATTTTSVPVTQDYTALAEGARALIQSYTFATSTTATTTSSVRAAVEGKGNGSIVIPDGSSLMLYMQQTYGNVCTGAVCETATSTNRGFNPKYKVRLDTYGDSF